MGLASGAAFAGYTVVRTLAATATGEIYLVQRSGLSGWQTLKVLPPAMSADPEFRQRFLAETNYVTNLHHPNILDVYDRGEFDGQLWVSMDYVDAVDAVQLMADRFPAVLPVDEVLSIVTAVADALDYAHRRGLLHRDVNPANVLLTDPGPVQRRILLCDFGITRSADQLAEYAAPELIAGGEIDARADQYALAATAMHLLTGAPPVDRSRPVPSQLDELRPDLAGLNGVLARAFAAQPNDRYASCGEFAAALNELAGAPTSSHTTAAPDPSPEEPTATGVVDYPVYDWPETADLPQQFAPPPPSLPRPPEPQPVEPTARTIRPRRIMAGSAAAVILLGGLLFVGIMIGRKTVSTAEQAGGAPPSASASPQAPSTTATAGVPAPLDGTYRIEIQRSRQTFDYILSPQPPDVTTWWAIRTSCSPTGCRAAATMLDEDNHEQAVPNIRPIVFDFSDGQWRSRPDKVQFPCVHANGTASTESTTQVLSLRPQPLGELTGEMVVTVHTDECGQGGKVIRIPAVVTRSGDVPPAVILPDPRLIPNAPKDSPTPTTTPPAPAPTPSGPGR
ncbi:serine/threonine protein kinase [Mycobacterium intermedium]|uniref:non-specific serine/threonine protein kinase n=1 Tax=Mycobacterium intermedium TaxID=28445 RepID=A0A1E3SGJ1_MYCIE|nr:serine/threonine-protein kinase [Mycobacterium intermedium]MCV6965711.1 serine/threonine protein kinase [Mycobacterium intermedium]ODR01182.1 serine/threonine protein kinase [Mycobacterium intermedium]OPE48556.1 serine/threonine protein kinase [Mycobacterium intermedium]ORB00986.1 serine/threonine protein kinase [Mycobacterium intermedium]